MAVSKFRQGLLIVLLAAAVFLAAAYPSYAASTADGVAAIDDFIDAFVQKGSGIVDRISEAATSLFWILAVIQFIWAGCRLALSGNYTLTTIAGTAVKEVLFIGFFLWLLRQGPSLGNTIVSGLRTLGGGGSINPGSIFSKGIQTVYLLTKAAFELGVHGAVWAVVPYALALTAFVFAAAYAAVYLLEFYIAAPLGVILLGLGGSVWSKKFAENYARVLIAIGFKLAALQIAINIASSTLDGLQTSLSSYSTIGTDGFFLHAFNLAGLAVLIFVTISKLPSLVSGLVAGTWFQSAVWTDFTAYASPSPVYGGFSGAGAGDRAQSVYQEEADTMRSSQYAAVGNYWQEQESSRASSQGGDLFAVSSGADSGSGTFSPSSPSSPSSQTSGAGETGETGEKYAPTESNFFGRPSSGRTDSASSVPADSTAAGSASASSASASTGGGLIGPSAGAGAALGTGATTGEFSSSSSFAPTESGLIKSSAAGTAAGAAPGSIGTAAGEFSRSSSSAPTESGLIEPSAAGAVAGAALGSAGTAAGEISKSSSSGPTESGLVEPSAAGAVAGAALGSAGTAAGGVSRSSPSEPTESGLIEPSAAEAVTGAPSESGTPSESGAPVESGVPAGAVADAPVEAAAGNAENISEPTASAAEATPAAGSAEPGAENSAGEAKEVKEVRGVDVSKEVNVSVNRTGTGGRAGRGGENLQNLRSVAVDSLVTVSGTSDGNQGMADFIQKQFPQTEMSPLQLEIFKGMAE
jgi:type IV secretion system protein TrbL